MLCRLGGRTAGLDGSPCMDNDTPVGGTQPPSAGPTPPLYPPTGPGTQELYPPQYGQPFPPGQYYYPPTGNPPGLPSRTLTIVITFFFGLFGLIPAYLHGKEAERLGGSSNRYWTAFGVTFAVSMLVWIALVLLAAGFFLAVESSTVTVVE